MATSLDYSSNFRQRNNSLSVDLNSPLQQWFLARWGQSKQKKLVPARFGEYILTFIVKKRFKVCRCAPKWVSDGTLTSIFLYAHMVSALVHTILKEHVGCSCHPADELLQNLHAKYQQKNWLWEAQFAPVVLSSFCGIFLSLFPLQCWKYILTQIDSYSCFSCVPAKV